MPVQMDPCPSARLSGPMGTLLLPQGQVHVRQRGPYNRWLEAAGHSDEGLGIALRKQAEWAVMTAYTETGERLTIPQAALTCEPRTPKPCVTSK